MADLFCSSAQWSAVTAWAASTAYSVGAIRRQLAAPTAGNERVFRCTTAGTSGASEPSWNLGAGATTTDNTVTWTEITGSSTYNSLGGSWTAPFARMRTAATRMAAGDRLFVLNDHAATEAAAVDIVFPGTEASPNQAIGVNGAGAVARGASESTTGNSTLTITSAGGIYLDSLRFNCGSGANAPNLTIGGLGGGNSEQVTTKDCDFALGGTGSFAAIFFRADGSSKGESRHINPRFSFGGTSNQFIGSNGSQVLIQGGGALAGTANAPAMFTFNSAAKFVIEGFDFSGYHAALDLFFQGFNGGYAVLRNCKLPASWSGSLFSSAPGSFERVEAYNMSEGDHNYRVSIEDDRGTLRDETTLVKTGGAGTGLTPMSWRIITTANASYPLRVFRSQDIASELIEAVGSPVTLTIDILRDSATNLTDAEVWVEVQYQGTSGFPLATFISDAKAILASAADQAASSATWTTTGMSNPNRQKLEVTFTPQEVGVAIVTVCVARASTTLYVDPVAQLS